MDSRSKPTTAPHARFCCRCAFVLIAAAGICFIAGLSLPAQAAIRVERLPMTIASNGEPATHFRFSATPSDGDCDEMIVDVIVPGAMDDPESDLVMNKEHTLFGFTIDQVGEYQDFLIAQGNGDQVLVIRDLGERTENLCDRAHHERFQGLYGHIDKIVGDTVYISSDSTIGQYNCYAVLRVLPDGQLTLVKFTMSPLNLTPYLAPPRRHDGPHPAHPTP